MPPLTQSELNEPITGHMHQNLTRLDSGLTVGEALEWVRRHPPTGRVIYFYVVDKEGRLEGVVPTRRLLLSAPATRLTEIMVRKLVTLPARATVLDACEFFIQYRLLAVPVVDDEGRLLGVVDIELYTDEFGNPGVTTQVERWLQPLASFLRVESSGGIVLLVCTVAALVLANSPWAPSYAALWQTPVHVTFGGFGLAKPLLLWVNDGLMTLFFFVVGLEIKREMVSGELSEPRKAVLPVVAALGGMVAPAAVYLALQWDRPTVAGWGVPMATDIAFVVGFLALLGPRVPHGLKILLLSLAIADDIGAALVIALAYTGHLSFPALAAGAAVLGVVVFFRWIGVRALPVYVALGAVIWVAFVKSGVHPTVAGVILGLLTPARPWLGDRVPLDVAADLFKRLRGSDDEPPPPLVERVAPVERLEHALHPWVAFAIMPVFALANAGVELKMGSLGQPVALAVAAGLVLGKPIGIVLASWLTLKIGLTQLPSGVNGKVLVGAGCLAGIGFTMSIFIAGLALNGPALDEAKVGILAGSTVSAALGSALLLRFLPRRAAE
ncbi:MAG: Na+/H+ antiporter NhaA [Planctomycetes bacterium]|nr:Na+/H+ antiporter NhaA [Planctomycetota bacterium]